MRRGIGALALAAVLATSGCAIVRPGSLDTIPVSGPSASGAATATSAPVITFEVIAPEGSPMTYTAGDEVRTKPSSGHDVWAVVASNSYLAVVYVPPSDHTTRCVIKIGDKVMNDVTVPSGHGAPTICSSVAPLPEIRPGDADPATGASLGSVLVTTTSDFSWIGWSSGVSAGEGHVENGHTKVVRVLGRPGDQIRFVALSILEGPASCSIAGEDGQAVSTGRANASHPIALCTAVLPQA